MKKYLLTFALLCSTAHAARAPLTQADPITSVLSAVGLDGAAATRTVTMSVGSNYAKIRLRVAYTYSAATSVTLTPTCSLDGTNFSSYTTRSCSGGACEMAPLTDVETGTSSFDYIYEYDVRGCQKFKVVFSGGGSPGAGDLITTQATVIVGD